MGRAASAVSLAQGYLARVPQYTRMQRHARAVLQHGSLRKWGNLARVEAERKLRRVTVTGHPYILFIDPCNFCNLRCPLCPTGMNQLGRPQAMLSLDCFKRYLEPHIPYAFEVNLHNWGESLLNKSVYAMIEHAQSVNIGTNLSSNLVIAQDEDLDRLLDSGLEHLTVSLDGVDQASYSTYRVRGDFERVIENMGELLRRRRQRRATSPFVEWQYIVMKHNESRVDEAAALARKLGVDRLRFIPVGLPYEARDRQRLAAEWFPTAFSGRDAGVETPQTFGQANRPSPCYYLYRSMVINADGGVSPCCIVYKEKRDFAHLEKDGPSDVMKIWNNDRFRSARSLYSAEAMDVRPKTVCDGCDIFARHPSKVRKSAATVASAGART
ncbi:MAG: radical SAM protein [Geminicoccaceae bacterium]